MLWLIFAILTVAIIAILLFPLLKRVPDEPSLRVDYDIVVYRNQLAEIEQEIERGLLTETQADAARAEIYRRMLAAEDALKTIHVAPGYRLEIAAADPLVGNPVAQPDQPKGRGLKLQPSPVKEIAVIFDDKIPHVREGAYRLLRPIAIDRRQRIGAMKQLLREGRSRLDSGIWIVLLPEGTRVNPGERVSFYRGGAALAHAHRCLLDARRAGHALHQLATRPAVQLPCPARVPGQDDFDAHRG